MADIVNPQAVRFANERIRVAADLIAQLDNFAYAVVNEWNALGMDKLIPDSADTVADGSDVDGRPSITGADCNAIIARLSEVRGDTTGLALEKAGVRDTVLKVAVNTTK